MTALLNVNNALEQILARIKWLDSETVALGEGLNRVLAANIDAEFDLPPFASSAMDGYAVRAADTASASRQRPATLDVTMDIRAGTAPEGAVGPGSAARIMTGAPVPPGADAVVPVEDTDSTWGNSADAPPPETVAVFKSLQSGDSVRPSGENIRRGETVLVSGTLLRPQEIGVLASLGHGLVPVIRQPRVAILSTGSELVELDRPLRPGQIYNSNGYTLVGLVQNEGCIPLRMPTAADSLDAMRNLFRSALELHPDVILSTAGVSVGAADFVRTVLDELGEISLWRINIRPGKPLAFGSLQSIPFFGLPGNPVSAMVTFDVLVRPALLKMGGRPDSALYDSATLAEDLESDGRRSYLRVRLAREHGKLMARLTGTQSSGALMSMVLADGLLIIPEGVERAAAGSEFRVRLLRPN